jgi:FdhE protein
MTQVGTPKQDPIPIGEVAKPPFVRLPDPTTLFAGRAARLTSLAEGHELRSYLIFLAELCAAQHRVQDGLPAVEPSDVGTTARAREFGMPPLDRLRFTPDAAMDATNERLLAMAGEITMPADARRALERLKAADAATAAAAVRAALSNAIPIEALAEHVFVAAVLQVHFARLAATLEAKALVPVGDGVCPACGGPPVSSMVVGWSDAHATRFCACSLCGTLWNYPRIRCTLCGSTQGIAYQEIARGPATAKAETCDSCHGYVKILQQHKDPALDPVADDVATLALDLLLRERGYRRGAVNPFALGY